MGWKRELLSFPERLKHGTRGAAAWYERRAECFAVHGELPAALAGARLFSLADDAITVCKGEPPEDLELGSAKVTPVYAPGPAGAPAVPTGRMFVRFREGVRAAGRAVEIARSGFAIEEIPPYASHAAWVVDRDGDIAAALCAVGALEALPDVENVEPQMLSPPGRRARRR